MSESIVSQARPISENKPIMQWHLISTGKRFKWKMNEIDLYDDELLSV